MAMSTGCTGPRKGRNALLDILRFGVRGEGVPSLDSVRVGGGGPASLSRQRGPASAPTRPRGCRGGPPSPGPSSRTYVGGEGSRGGGGDRRDCAEVAEGGFFWCPCANYQKQGIFYAKPRPEGNAP